MLLEGIALGGLSLVGFGLSYKKLPVKVKRVVLQHPLLSEVVMVVFFYEILGMTLVAHIACGTMVLGAMATFHVARNPKDYQFIFDAIDSGKDALKSVRKQLQELNDKHVAAKQLEVVK